MSRSAQTGPAPGDYALLLLLGLVWGSTYMFIEIALRSLPPLTVAAARAAISFLVLGGLALALAESFPRDARSWRAFALMGLVGMALPFSMMTFGQRLIDSSLAAVIITIMPLFTLGLAHLFTDDKASPRKLAGVGLGFLGILLLLGPTAAAGEGGTLLGQLLYVGVALCFAVMQVLIRRLGAEAGSLLARTSATLFCGSLWLVPAALLLDRPWSLAPRLDSLLAVLGIGLLSTALAHYLLFRLNARAGPNFVAANNYIAPVVGIFWGKVLLDEPVTALRLLAVAVIFSGIALALTRTGVARQNLR